MLILSQKTFIIKFETFDYSKVVAYNLVVVWTKIILENGFKNFDTSSTIYYAHNLLYKNIPLCEDREMISLDAFLSCKNCLPRIVEGKCVRTERWDWRKPMHKNRIRDLDEHTRYDSVTCVLSF